MSKGKSVYMGRAVRQRFLANRRRLQDAQQSDGALSPREQAILRSMKPKTDEGQNGTASE